MRVEYAKSKRSQCKKCTKNIGLGSIRVHIGLIKNSGWYHLRCFPVHHRPTRNMLFGIEKLKDGDRERVQGKIEEWLDVWNARYKRVVPYDIWSVMPKIVSDEEGLYSDRTGKRKRIHIDLNHSGSASIHGHIPCFGGTLHLPCDVFISNIIPFLVNVGPMTTSQPPKILVGNVGNVKLHAFRRIGHNLSVLACVCQDMYEILSNDILWKSLVSIHFSVSWDTDQINQAFQLACDRGCRFLWKTAFVYLSDHTCISCGVRVMDRFDRIYCPPLSSNICGKCSSRNHSVVHERHLSSDTKVSLKSLLIPNRSYGRKPAVAYLKWQVAQETPSESR